MFTATEKKKAKRLGKEFPGVSSHTTILRLVHDHGEDAARKQLTEWAKTADAELREKGISR